MRSLLVTVLGTKPRRACYTFDGRMQRATLAPVALTKLLPEVTRPERILALCTASAREESLPALRQELCGKAEIVCVDIAEEPSEHLKLLSCLCEHMLAEGGWQAVIDITHGPRHFALYALLGMQYLIALRKIPLVGAYYAWLRDEPECSPLIDLRPLLELSEWIHAVRVFGESGDAAPLAKRIDAAQRQSAERIKRELLQISQARAAGLPLELGLLSRSFHSQEKEFRKILCSQGVLLVDELWRELELALSRFALDPSYTNRPKSEVVLNRDELIRQAKLIDDLLEHGSVPTALGLMQEWTVSCAVLCDGRPQKWLEFHPERRAAAAKLDLLRTVVADKELPEVTLPQRKLGKFFNDLTDLRNGYAHHGMRPKQLIGADADQAKKQRDCVEEYWRKLKSAAEIPIKLQANGKLLVSAQGTSPGVLFSAIEACRRANLLPDKCFVLCSEQSAASVEEALCRSNFKGPVEKVPFTDPYGGRSEIKRIEKAARKYLIAAEQVLINLTGGTTLMGLAVAEIAETARRFARLTRRFGLIDPRRPEEQQAEPFRASEAFWLDEENNCGD
jgi:hypothetical protein